ncbi:MAG: MupG family TIM beta-alpha barrel fold protein [Caloramator sp.]|nr:MupG family TIM beta-alpha barrel fold protein [Caloramator sp.]
MKKLGISVYMNNATLDENINYIKLASSYGFKRIFTCLISLSGKSINSSLEEFKKMVSFANSCDMEVVADISPEIFKRYEINYKDLSFFKELGLYGIRLDLGFSGLEESIMTFNKYNLKIELNCSNGTKYLDNILSFKPNIENLIACHNFYPRLYTGLSYEHFEKCSRHFKKFGIRTAAFINSKNAAFGPWPLSEGLCTLESHRNLPIQVQAKHLFATKLIDDVIIANAFASEEELKKLSRLSKNITEFSVKLENDIDEIERKIVLDEIHFNRGDVSEYVIRSTQSREKYSNHNFKLYNARDIKKGDILIDSSLYGRYAGELQIALKDMKNTGKTNVVGRICDDEIFLLDYIKPWDKFCFVENK